MPAWLDIAIGIVFGTGVIAGAIYLAFRPYLSVKPPKAWMPESTGSGAGHNYPGTGGPGGPGH